MSESTTLDDIISEDAFKEFECFERSVKRSKYDNSPIFHPISSSCMLCDNVVCKDWIEFEESYCSSSEASAKVKEEENIAEVDSNNNGFLTLLPAEITIKILSCLSATDLLSLSKASRLLKQYTDDHGLWRRLYLNRWEDIQMEKKRRPSWKVLYLERDAEDCRRILETSPPDLSTIFLEMQKAQRKQYLPMCSSDEICSISTTLITDQIQNFIKENNLPGPVEQRPASITALGPFAEFGDTFICKNTGWVHFCGKNCDESLMFADSPGWVCPVSGRTTFLLMNERDVYEIEKINNGDQEENENDYSSILIPPLILSLNLPILIILSHLPNAYEVGYNCESEEELRSIYG